MHGLACAKGHKSSAVVQRHVFAVHGTLVDVQDGDAPAPHYPAALGLSAKPLFDAIECTAHDVAKFSGEEMEVLAAAVCPVKLRVFFGSPEMQHHSNTAGLREVIAPYWP